MSESMRPEEKIWFFYSLPSIERERVTATLVQQGGFRRRALRELVSLALLDSGVEFSGRARWEADLALRVLRKPKIAVFEPGDPEYRKALDEYSSFLFGIIEPTTEELREERQRITRNGYRVTRE